MSSIGTRTERRDNVLVLHVEGYLSADAHTGMAVAFAAACKDAKAIADPDAQIVFAFRDGDYINSAGVGILIELVMEGKERSVAFRFAHPSAHFRKIFEIVGLTKYVDVFPSTEEALAGF